MSAPSYPLTMPSDPPPENLRFGPKNETDLAQSNWTGSAQAGINPFHQWIGQFTIPRMERADAGQWISFITQLRGRGGTFQFPVPGTDTLISGYAGAAGLVNGASQTGYTLVTDGWGASQTVLEVGDMFTVNNELKVVRTTCISDGFGAATITFDPPLRNSPANDAPLTIINPYVVMALENDFNSWDISAPVLMRLTLKCEERF